MGALANLSAVHVVSLQVRVPAWTDRILFKIEDENNMDATLHSYESIDEIYGSDHKPVTAHLCLRLRQVSIESNSNGPSD